jgi:hypothetical protein
VRFDYDPVAAKPGHPATHLTINSADCRIACVAPLHVGSFVDFIFSSFYPTMRLAHTQFFANLGGHIGQRSLTDDEANSLHLSWAQPQ